MRRVTARRSWHHPLHDRGLEKIKKRNWVMIRGCCAIKSNGSASVPAQTSGLEEPNKTGPIAIDGTVEEQTGSAHATSPGTSRKPGTQAHALVRVKQLPRSGSAQTSGVERGGRGHRWRPLKPLLLALDAQCSRQERRR